MVLAPAPMWHQGSLLELLFVWWTTGGGRSAVVSCSLVGPVFAGWWWLVEPACGETQEEQSRVSRGSWSDLEFAGTC